MSKLYWAPVYNHGDKTDHIIELEQIETDSQSWRVTVDDDEFTMSTATDAKNFWELVREAISLHQSR